MDIVDVIITIIAIIGPVITGIWIVRDLSTKAMPTWRFILGIVLSTMMFAMSTLIILVILANL